MNTTDPASSRAATAPLLARLAMRMELAGGKHALVLGGFSLAATLLLALAYGLTREPIAQSALKDLRQSLAQVIPADIHDNNPAADTVWLQLDWITRFTGKSLGDPPDAQWAVKKDGGTFDQFAGATITPRAVVNGVRDGLRLFAAHRKTLLEEVSP